MLSTGLEIVLVFDHFVKRIGQRLGIEVWCLQTSASGNGRRFATDVLIELREADRRRVAAVCFAQRPVLAFEQCSQNAQFTSR